MMLKKVHPRYRFPSVMGLLLRRRDLRYSVPASEAITTEWISLDCRSQRGNQCPKTREWVDQP